MKHALRHILFLLALFWSGALLALPQIEHWQTRNGAQIYFVATHGLPMLDVQILFDAGSARDAIPGVASLTANLLSEGAGTLDADAIAERFDALGARFVSSAGRDYASLSLRSLTQPGRLNPALETFGLILRAPSFPAAAFERQRQRTLIGLKAREQNPGAIADRLFYQALYADHPYAHPVSGSEQSVSTLARDDLVQHYRQYYVARNAIVIMVGDLSRAEAERIAEQLLAPLPAGSAPPPLPAVNTQVQAQTLTRAYPSSQTHLLLGQPVLRRGDPDYFPLYVGNHILGGSGLVSRISDEVREQRGLAYSAYSYFSPMRDAGPFQLGAQTRNETAQEAESLLRSTLERYRNEGPSEAELHAAKQNITGGFPLNIDSNGKILGYLSMIAFYGMPLDYLDRFIDRINSVSLEQIRDAFQRRVSPDALIAVRVGGD